jgi:hypothetical protein
MSSAKPRDRDWLSDILRQITKDPVKSMENIGHIRYKQYIWKVPCKYQGGCR